MASQKQLARSILYHDFYFFDFDGVLADTVELKGQGFAELYRKYGQNIYKKVFDFHMKHGGMSRFEKFKYWHKNFLKRNITQKELDILSRRFNSLILGKTFKQGFTKGSLEFLRLCSRENKKCFLVSAVPHKDMVLIAKKKKIAQYFVEIAGSPATKEKNLHRIIVKHKINPKKAVYFGDAKTDLIAARANGVKFVGINYFDKSRGYRNFSEMLSLAR